VASAARHPGGDPARRRYEADDGVEVALPKGDVTEGVVRAGGTVRRPHQPQSTAVAGYLDHLERVGFAGSPRYLGRDDQGRDVLTFLPGAVAGDPPEMWAADDTLLGSVATLLHQLHTASAGYAADRGFRAAPGAVWRRDLVPVEIPVTDPTPELISHLDVTPQNVVVRNGCAAGLIDFDLAGPTTRLLDVYNTAMHWVPLVAPQDIWPSWRGPGEEAPSLRGRVRVEPARAGRPARPGNRPGRHQLAPDEGFGAAVRRWLGAHVGGRSG
jgi:hypothetical protein